MRGSPPGTCHGIGLLQHLVHIIFLRKLCQIDRIAIVLRHQFQTILHHRHHAKPEQVHLDEPEVRAILLIPLHHRATGHGGSLNRHDMIELSLADDHATGVLAEVSGQILQSQA